MNGAAKATAPSRRRACDDSSGASSQDGEQHEQEACLVEADHIHGEPEQHQRADHRPPGPPGDFGEGSGARLQGGRARVQVHGDQDAAEHDEAVSDEHRKPRSYLGEAARLEEDVGGEP